MRILGVIPARWGSTRFEGKVLAEIAGKPMIQYVFEQAKKSKCLDDVLIACDDERILKAAQNFKAKAVLTSKDHPSGTDRIAQAVKNISCGLVINIQGDEPLIEPSVIDQLASAMREERSALVGTVIKKVETTEEIEDPNIVKVVIDHHGYALYFSRSVIPYPRDQKNFTGLTYYKHLGIYAYRKDFLLNFKNLPKSKLESAEKLEQLRILEAGYKVKTTITDVDTIGVDTLEDLKKVEEAMQRLREEGVSSGRGLRK